MDLLSPVMKSEQYAALTEALSKKPYRAALFGAMPIHRSLYAAAISRTFSFVIYLCESDSEAMTASVDMHALGQSSAFFPSRDFVFIDVESISHDSEMERLSVLGRLCEGSLDSICCSVEAFCQFTIPKELYKASSIVISKGSTFAIPALSVRLVDSGYTRSDRVEGRGQFSIRGGIVDIFPAQNDHPIRLEFFGDEVDTVTSFDEETQRRFQSLEGAVITPAREVILSSVNKDHLTTFAQKCKKHAEALYAIVQRDISLLEAGITPACTDRYLRELYQVPATVADYFSDCVLFLSDPSAIAKRHKNLLWQHTEELLSLEKQGLYLRHSGSFYAEQYDEKTIPTVLCDSFTRTISEDTLGAVVNIQGGSMPKWDGTTAVLVDDLRMFTDMKYSCVVLAGTERAAHALASDLMGAGLSVSSGAKSVPANGTVAVEVGSLSSGFDLPLDRFCVISGRLQSKEKRRTTKTLQKKGHNISSIEDLRIGDYIVHQSHGIGIYDGIHRIDHYGLIQDYVKIKYQGQDTLYVPVTQLNMISQYISPKGDENVKIAKLHSGDWNKTRQNVYRSVREMAKELIELYAKRENTTGTAFSEDTDWQREFETRFAYEETDDQLRSAQEIKRDMEKSRPMDRLLCGDVGVGKTEVALRAIFKCVCDGYQCAVLVPTTILAWQHYHTFLERLEAYPVKVAMLSRFTTAADIKKAVAGIKNGTVDVAVGTHRLLQKDISFKKLGLVVVDEEQRFGVAHKERLKQAFSGVDVLTLSATPIPRTLNMAMSGIRDMSVIEQPPEDRHPVQTFVLEYDESILVDAIKRELSRGGQVYYLHNRVETIEKTAAKLSALLPDAAIETAHGRMDETSLSAVWQRLINGQVDILVCTTIIETGIDVPNCNTLIVEDSDRMGLSQLYQIRGRVGRSGRRAFAYFTFQRDKVLTDVASKRLSAIRDFTSFGSGFKIAMRDLQIRGAGSVLSARQSGHMAAVGYETYLKILEQAVRDEEGGLEYTPPKECIVDLSVSAFIPNDYIKDNESRIEIYKRIAAIETPEDASDVHDELRDRFGAVPQSVSTLISVALIRVRAAALGFYEVGSDSRENRLLLYSDDIDPQRLSAYLRRSHRRIMISAKGKSYISVVVATGESITAVAEEILSAYAG